MDDPDADAIDRLAGDVRAADSTVALTGAGISVASGVPTFRGEDGIWERFDPADFRYARFRSDPAGFWADRLDLRDAMYGDREVAPNAAHRALADLADADQLDAVVTQNTDGLHADAGGDAELIELHGNARRAACRSCGRRYDASPVFERVRGGEAPPTCECGGVLKPDVVLFGESLDDADLARARSLAADADVLLAVGSSLTVEPAASLPRTAARDGVLAVVNLESTPVSGLADYDLRADLADALPRLRDAVLG